MTTEQNESSKRPAPRDVETVKDKLKVHDTAPLVSANHEPTIDRLPETGTEPNAYRNPEPAWGPMHRAKNE